MVDLELEVADLINAVYDANNALSELDGQFDAACLATDPLIGLTELSRIVKRALILQQFADELKHFANQFHVTPTEDDECDAMIGAIRQIANAETSNFKLFEQIVAFRRIFATFAYQDNALQVLQQQIENDDPQFDNDTYVATVLDKTVAPAIARIVGMCDVLQSLSRLLSTV